MMFWMGVAVCYMVIIAVGMTVGRHFGDKNNGDGGPPLYVPEEWIGPSGGIRRELSDK